MQLCPEQSVDKSVLFRNPAPSCSPHHGDSEATNKGEEEVPFTQEQIQWVDSLIASRATPRLTSTWDTSVVVRETWPAPWKCCQVVPSKFLDACIIVGPIVGDSSPTRGCYCPGHAQTYTVQQRANRCVNSQGNSNSPGCEAAVIRAPEPLVPQPWQHTTWLISGKLQIRSL